MLLGDLVLADADTGFQKQKFVLALTARERLDSEAEASNIPSSF